MVDGVVVVVAVVYYCEDEAAGVVWEAEVLMIFWRENYEIVCLTIVT